MHLVLVFHFSNCSATSIATFWVIPSYRLQVQMGLYHSASEMKHSGDAFCSYPLK